MWVGSRRGDRSASSFLYGVSMFDRVMIQGCRIKRYKNNKHIRSEIVFPSTISTIMIFEPFDIPLFDTNSSAGFSMSFEEEEIVATPSDVIRKLLNI